MNILVAGVGGQGLVLTTQIISEAASQDGWEVKSNDVIGLSQRGGKVWGSVKLGREVHSPNIVPGKADVLIGLEPLEALRWQHYLKPEGVILLNQAEIYPVYAIAEQAPYPHPIQRLLRGDLTCHSFDMAEISRELGSTKMINVIFIGMLSTLMDISTKIWQQVIAEQVPQKFTELNLKAFQAGRRLMKEATSTAQDCRS